MKRTVLLPPLIVAAFTLWTLMVAPGLLVEGVGGAVFGVAAVLSVAFAVAALALRALRGRIAFPAPSAMTVATLVGVSVALAGAVLSVEPDPGARLLIAVGGPTLGVLLVGLGWWFRREVE